MKDVARMIRSHVDGIVAWTQTRQANGLLEAINGLFQAVKRKARGDTHNPAHQGGVDAHDAPATPKPWDHAQGGQRGQR